MSCGSRNGAVASATSYRLRCNIRSASDAAAMNTYTSDLSVGGCYVETARPFKVDTCLKIALSIAPQEFSIKGIVRASYPDVGMGIEFLDLSWQDTRTLHDFLATRGGET